MAAVAAKSVADMGITSPRQVDTLVTCSVCHDDKIPKADSLVCPNTAKHVYCIDCFAYLVETHCDNKEMFDATNGEIHCKHCIMHEDSNPFDMHDTVSRFVYTIFDCSIH